MESYNFQSTLSEQQALLFSIIKLIKKFLGTLYKKSGSLITIKQIIQDNMEKINSIYFKDTLSERNQYIYFVNKLVDLYDQLLQKAMLFRIISDKVFQSHQSYKFIDSDSIFKGFFFLFVYKDLFLRDIIQRIKENLKNEKSIKILD